MSELKRSQNQQLQEHQSTTEQGVLPTAGALLRAAREAHGLHIGALAVALKVPVKKLEALEADRYELLPDAVFTRALASSVCRTLKIDASPVLERLPQKSGLQLDQTGWGINAPFRDVNAGQRFSAAAQVSRPAIFAVIALLLGAMVLIFLPAFKAGLETVKNGLAEVGAAGRLSPAPASSGSQNADPGSTSQSDQNAEGAKAPQTLSTQSAALPLLTNTLAVPTASGSKSTSALSSGTDGLLPATSLSVVGATAQNTVTGIVAFTAKNTSWIEVTDATRKVVLRRTLNPGESVGVNGVLPLAVIVGRADSIEVLVRGKSFELATYSSNNVARFEVK